MSAVSRFLSGWGFPAFLISTLLFATSLLVLVLVFPAESTPFEQFSEDFKVWCFGYDPASGAMQWAYVVSFISSPILLAVFTAMIWWEPLRVVRKEQPRRLLRAAGPAALLVATLAVVMGFVGAPSSGSADASELPFPAEALRTEYEPPAFAFVDQNGETVALEGLRDKVVVVTGVYGTCGLTCPMILGQARRVVGGLSEEQQRDVTVVAITLDPEHDTPETMGRMARAQGVEAPLFRLVSGDPAEVNGTLDRLGFARSRDPETGIIDHANLFLLIDRRGRIAYRFSLGEQQEEWLGEALELLVREGSGDHV